MNRVLNIEVSVLSLVLLIGLDFCVKTHIHVQIYIKTIVILYVKEELETFCLSPLGKIDLFALFIYNEMYFKLLPENGCV